MNTSDRTRVGWLLVVAALTAIAVSAVWAVRELTSSQDLGAAEVATIIGLPVAALMAVAAVVPIWRSIPPVDLVQSAGALASRVRKLEGRERVQLLGGDTVPIDLEFRFVPSAGRDAKGAASCGTLADVVGYYRQLKPQRMVITGENGSGKTVLAIELVLALLVSRADGDPVPVRVSLPGWDVGIELTGWLADLIADMYKVSPQAAQALVEARLVLPVLDGLDELDTDFGSAEDAVPSRVAALVSRLNEYRPGGQPGALVLTSRGLAYDALMRAGADRLHDAARIEIQPVTPEQAAEYLLSRTRNEDRWWPVCEHLLNLPKSVLAAVLSTPWRLNLAYTIYESGNDPAELLTYTDAGALQTDLLARYVGAAVKLAPWLGESDAPAERDERWADKDQRRVVKVQRWLRTLAVLLSQQIQAAEADDHIPEISAINGTDLVPHLLWPAAGIKKVRVVHAVLGSATLTAAIITVSVALGEPLPLATTAVSPAAHRNLFTTIISTALIVATLATLGWFGWGYRWSRVHVGTQPHSKFRARALAGWLWNAAQSRSRKHGFMYTVQVAASLASDRNLTEARTVVQRRQDRAGWSARARIGSPMDSLRAYPKYIIGLALFVTIFISLAITVSALVIIGIPNLVATHGFPVAAIILEFFKVGLSLGIFFLAIGVVWLSATPWTRYMVGIALAALRPHSQLPLRLGQFLEWGCRAGLLRRAGAAYQFRHRDLQEWLLRCNV